MDELDDRARRKLTPGEKARLKKRFALPDGPVSSKRALDAAKLRTRKREADRKERDAPDRREIAKAALAILLHHDAQLRSQGRTELERLFADIVALVSKNHDPVQSGREVARLRDDALEQAETGHKPRRQQS